jgi:hypothetical protein
MSQQYRTIFDAQQLELYQELELKLPSCKVRYLLNGYQEGEYNSFTRLVSEKDTLHSFCPCFKMLEYFDGNHWNYVSNFTIDQLNYDDFILDSDEDKNNTEDDNNNTEYDKNNTEDDNNNTEYDKNNTEDDKNNTPSEIKRPITHHEFKMKEFLKKVELCVEYETFGEFKQSTIYKKIRLGAFLNNQIQLYRNGKLSEDRLDLMKQIKKFNEFCDKEVVEAKAKLEYKQRVQLCIEFERTDELKQSTIYKDIKLGTFLKRQIQAYRKGNLSEERLKLMSNVQKFMELTNS